MISRYLFIHASIYLQSPGATKRQDSTWMHKAEALIKRDLFGGAMSDVYSTSHATVVITVAFAAYFVGVLALVTLR